MNAALLAAAAGALRYRFFLFAGLFPYLLGAAAAYRATGLLDGPILVGGMLAVLCVGIGIEGLNEHFDATMGGDRVFASAERVRVGWPLPVGIGGFAAAGLFGLYLTWARGWPVAAFALAGLGAALSYLMPPLRLTYRGLGETVIALSYGPGLTLGGYWLQARSLSWQAAAASLLPGLLIFALAVANEIPDYYGDRLVGKRNIAVRLGRKGTARLYALATAACFACLAAGVTGGAYPRLLGLALLLAPVAVANAVAALRYYDSPHAYRRVIRGAILLYVLLNALAAVSYGLATGH